MSVKANAVPNRLNAYAVDCGISKGRRDSRSPDRPRHLGAGFSW